MGSLRLGKLVRFIPYPVVGGFLAGTGWLIIKFAFAMTAGVELSISNLTFLLDQSNFVRWFPGLLFGLLLLIGSPIYKPLFACSGCYHSWDSTFLCFNDFQWILLFSITR